MWTEAKKENHLCNGPFFQALGEPTVSPFLGLAEKKIKPIFGFLSESPLSYNSDENVVAKRIKKIIERVSLFVMEIENSGRIPKNRFDVFWPMKCRVLKGAR